MVETFLDILIDTFRPASNYGYILYSLFAFLVLGGLIMALWGSHFRRRSRRLEAVIMRHESVHQAVDDLMFLVVSYLPSIQQKIIGSLNDITSQKLLNQQSTSILNEHGRALARFCNDFPVDNDNATIQSNSQNEILVGKAKNPFRSVAVWMFCIITIATLTAVNINSPRSLPFSFQIIGTILGLLMIIVGHHRFSRALSLQNATEKQASRKAGQLQVRREHVADATQSFESIHTSLMTDSQQLSNIPQAQDFFDGLVLLARITKGLSDTYRISEVSAVAPLYDVSAALNKRITSSYQPVATKRGLKLTTDIPKGLAFHILPFNLQKLMDALVENAFTYTQTGTVIQIKGRRHGDQVLISVFDHGPGIPEEVLNHVFQPLALQSSPHHSSAPQISGTKISLSLQICKLIMARIGGELRIKTKPGKGTLVVIRAPRHQTDMTLNIPRTISKSSGQLS